MRSAGPADAPHLLRIRRSAGAALTRDHGKGPWSLGATERGIAREIAGGTALVADAGSGPLGMLLLGRRRPWAIDQGYFTPAVLPLYLTSMAVDPVVQRRGVGRALIAAAADRARTAGADAIRLDAYDAPAGAGGFYAACGFAAVGRVTYRGTPLGYYELLL